MLLLLARVPRPGGRDLRDPDVIRSRGAFLRLTLTKAPNNGHAPHRGAPNVTDLHAVATPRAQTTGDAAATPRR